MCLRAPALIAPQPGEVGGRAQLQGFRLLAAGGIDRLLKPGCRFGLLAGFGQDGPPQPIQLGLIVALLGRGSGFGRPIQRSERVLELTGQKVSLGQNAKPLRIEQVSAATVPVRQASAKLDDSLRLPIKGGQSEAPAYVSESEPLWQVMLNREIDRRLSAFLCRVKLTSQLVHSRRDVQGEGETVGVRKPLG
jgi:hypothetical protein